MDPKTKNTLKVAAGVLLYYSATRRAREQFARGDIVETASGPALTPWSKFERGFRGVGKFLWGYMANEGLRGLGMSEQAALSWTIIGAASVEWYVLTYKTKFVKVPKSLSPAVGWEHGWGHGHEHHDWDHHGWGDHDFGERGEHEHHHHHDQQQDWWR